MSVGVTSLNQEISAENRNIFSVLEILRTNEILSVNLTRLVQRKFLGKLLSSKHHREGVSSTILEIDFSDFNSVISEVVVQDIGNLTEDVVAEDFSVVLEELLLRGDLTTSKFVLSVVLHGVVLLRDVLSEGDLFPVIGRR